jgi:hypothetical protein
MWPWLGTAVLAVAASVSCGTGIRDGQGDLYATKTIGPEGGQIVLREATLDFGLNCVDPPAPITLRRFDSIAQTGAVGPVFQIQVPSPGTFNNQPTITISTLDTVASDSRYAIGFLVPAIRQWFPNTNTNPPPCAASSALCAEVQIQSFTQPNGPQDPLKTTTLDLAIVQKCMANSECPTGQNMVCSGTACQLCSSGFCN